MSKQDRHLVVGFIGEVLVCVGEDVSGDVHVDGVNPTRMCHRSFGVVRRNKEVCEGGTELIFLRGCYSSSRVIDWELKVTIGGCAFCDGETDLYR